MNAATFFNPNGRLSRGQFLQAALVLIAISFVSALSGLVPGTQAAMAASSVATLVGFVVMYMWIAIWVKRLHNAGTTGWMFLLIGFGWLILSQIVNTTVQMVVAPEMNTAMAEAMSSDGFMAMFEIAAEYGARLAIPVGLANALVSLVYAAGLNALLSNKTEDNRYGPGPEGGVSKVFE
jgi:uncharacterized membrane protein YhaH (DUF805 family)